MKVMVMSMNLMKRGKEKVMNMTELLVLTGPTSSSRNGWIYIQSNVSDTHMAGSHFWRVQKQEILEGAHCVVNRGTMNCCSCLRCCIIYRKQPTTVPLKTGTG